MPVDAGSCGTPHVCRHKRSENGCAGCKVRLISVCSALSLAELEELEASSRHFTLDKGESLFGQGDPAHSVFKVIEGALRLTRLLLDGRRQVRGSRCRVTSWPLPCRSATRSRRRRSGR
jgi:CRP/FNR family transcriptional regulator